MKRNDALDRSVEYHFWRSYQGEEIDLIELENRALEGFEFKWSNKNVLPKMQKIYQKDLKGINDLQIITSDNLSLFLRI